MTYPQKQFIVLLKKLGYSIPHEIHLLYDNVKIRIDLKKQTKVDKIKNKNTNL